MGLHYPDVDWRGHKTVVMESDDWGGCTRTPAPDLATLEKALPLWRQSTLPTWQPWSGGSLETVDQMEQLFSTFRAFLGSDGRHPMFSPAYIVANPDFDAIRSNGFSEYVEIPLADGFPRGWERSGTLEKARTGIDEGLWYPMYHSRMHHYSGPRWVELLRSGDNPLLRNFFDLNMFGVASLDVNHVGLEFDGMNPAQAHEHLAGGLSHFHDAFGFMPDCVAREGTTNRRDYMIHTLEDILTYLQAFDPTQPGNSAGQAPSELTVWLNRKTYLKMMGQIEHIPSGGTDNALAATTAAWGDNRPAVISTHRANYTRLCEDEQLLSLAELSRYFDTITTAHPDAAFLTTSEIAQIFQRGTSTVRFGNNIICRNYTRKMARIEVILPIEREVGVIYNLRSETIVAHEQMHADMIGFNVPDGDFCIVLG